MIEPAAMGRAGNAAESSSVRGADEGADRGTNAVPSVVSSTTRPASQGGGVNRLNSCVTGSIRVDRSRG